MLNADFMDLKRSDVTALDSMKKMNVEMEVRFSEFCTEKKTFDIQRSLCKSGVLSQNKSESDYLTVLFYWNIYSFHYKTILVLDL